MERRKFLASLAAFAATATLDLERLLWRPTTKIFIPPAHVCKTFDFEAYLAKAGEKIAEEIDQRAIALYMTEFGKVRNIYPEEFYLPAENPICPR